MAFYRNQSGQRFVFLTLDVNGDPLTGDSANITAQVSIDAGVSAASNNANPTEIDATDHPGIVNFAASQAETNGDLIVVTPASSTAGVTFSPASLAIYTTPGNNTALAADVDKWRGATPAALADTDKVAVSVQDETLGLSTFDVASDAVDVAFIENTDATDYFSGLLNSITVAITAGTASVLTRLLSYVQLLARKDAGIATDKAVELSEINTDEGSGAGGYDNADDAIQGIRDRGDAAWKTGAGGGGGGEPGGVSVTIALQDQDANPIADVRTWITSDADGDTIVDGAYRSDVGGNVTFTLVSGSVYYLWAIKAGQQAVDGQLFTALAD